MSNSQKVLCYITKFHKFKYCSLLLFSERELYVCCLSVTLVHRYPTQAVVIFCNISTAFDTSLAIRYYPQKILRRSSEGNPSAGGVKHNRGSQI